MRFSLYSFVLPVLFAAAASASGAVSPGAGFIRQGAVSGDLRSYFMNRTFSGDFDSVQQANALGGRLLYETKAVRDFSVGLAFYTAQRMPFTPDDTEGTNLLGPDQTSFSVLGQSYLKYAKGNTTVKLFRQALDTPFMNQNDIKVIPVTYEAYTVENRDIKELKLMGSFVTGVKTWNSDHFDTLAYAGGGDNVNRPIVLLGAVYTPADDLTVQLWNYQLFDFFNTSYFQADKTLAVKDGWTYTLSGQAMAQTDTGNALSGQVKAAMFGILAGARTGGLLVNAGYTQAAHGTDFINPYASFPGYTSIMEEDCDLAGEHAWVAHADYDFSHAGAPGFIASVYHTQAYVAGGDFLSPHQYENNLILRYSFSGKLDGLSVTGKAAYVTNSQSTGGVQYNDLRLITMYKF